MTIAAISKPQFSLKTLQKDSNCIAIQDPSAVWGIQDFLPRRNLLLATDTLATQNVTVVATGYVLYMQGTGSITLSGTGSGTLNGTGANDRVVLSFTPTAGTLTLTVSGTVTYGMLCRADTIDQSYQKITDWTTEQYAWAAQRQVPWLRRNYFNGTNDFTLSVWGKQNGAFSLSGTTPIDSNTASLFTESAGTSFHRWFQVNAMPAGSYTISAYFKAGTRQYAYLEPYLGSPIPSVAIDLLTGSVIDLTDTTTATVYTVVDAGNGWWKISIPFTTATSGNLGAYIGTASGDGGTRQTSGSGTIYVYAASMVLTAYAGLPYQPILASWDATYTAAALAAGYPISMWQEDAGTNAVNGDDQPIGKMLDQRGNYTSTQATAANRPKWRLDSNGKAYIERDTVNDALPITLPNLGSDCEVFVGIGSTVSEAVDQTISGGYAPITPAVDYGRVIFKTTPKYRPKLIKWLLAKAGY